MSNINLSDIAAGIGGFVINGQYTGDSSGWSVAAAGDVNGDGFDDLIVGAPNNQFSLPQSGRSYVVFGKADGTAVNLDTLAGLFGGGFSIDNWLAFGDKSGYSVAAAGDVNGDGLADLIVGTPYNDHTGNAAGLSSVVFGKADTNEVSLGDITSGNEATGFAIRGQAAGDTSGWSVASAGDVNGDGLVDLIVGAPGAGSDAGRSYVVFGRADPTAVDLNAIAAGTGGFVIEGQAASDFSGASVSAAGDVNGDGLTDLIVGALEAGRGYVVFGKTDTTAVELDAITGGTGGFVFVGDSRVMSVSTAGDVNGDGLADLIVGEPWAGRSYVVFGKTDGAAIDFAAVAAGTGGFVINGATVDERNGQSVAAAGDVNGDGLADLIVGAPTTGLTVGRGYVVFGKTDGPAVNLSDVATGTGGFAIDGLAMGDGTGYSVAAAGDVNGDGLADLIVGVRYANTGDAYGNGAGRSYVIFGGTTGAFADTAVDWQGTGGNESHTGTLAAETFVGGAGHDILTGGGGADALYGGTGDDTFVLNADNLAQLAAGPTGGQLARVDGGTGLDTLALDGAGLSLDLTAIKNASGATPFSTSRIESVETIDLTGSGDNSLTLNGRDVVDMAGMNQFNSGTGWTGLAASVAKHQLVIDGDAGDTANLADSADWHLVGTASAGGQTYNVYDHDTAAVQVLIDQDVQSNAPCFLLGTRLLTRAGYVPVEDLRPGGEVRTLAHGWRKVVWLGYREVARNAAGRFDHAVQPIRVHQGAFGPGLPARDLWLSPDHAVFFRHHLIPAKALVNRDAITREPEVDAITYYHVLLDRHSVVFSEGLPTESYCPQENLDGFENLADCPVEWRSDLAAPIGLLTDCHPRVATGPVVETARAFLARRADASSGHRDECVLGRGAGWA